MFSLHDLSSVQNLLLYPGDYTYPNSGASPNVYKICDLHATALLTNVIKRQSILLFCLSVFVIGPLYLTIIEREHAMIFAAVLPFTDPTTDEGFYVNFIHEVVLLLIPVPAVFGVELVICMINNSILVTAELIEDSIQSLDESLRRNPEFTNQRSWELRNLILKIQDFDR